MALQKTLAVVLRRVLFQNSSLIVSFLSPDAGLIEAVAKGARREKSPLAGTLDYFNSGELVYYEKKSGSLELVSQFSVENERPRLKRDVLTSAAASFVCDIAACGCAPGYPVPKAWRLLEDTLDVLENIEGSPTQNSESEALNAALVFILKFLEIQGFALPLTECVSCGAELERGECAFAVDSGGFLCGNCSREINYSKFSAAAIGGLRFLYSSDLGGIGKLNLRKADMSESVHVLSALCSNHFGRRLKTSGVLLKLL